MSLAIFGGNPVREKSFPSYCQISDEEINAVTRVLREGCLSKFIGKGHPDFFGGEQVQLLEKNWSRKFRVEYSISMNSATSALYAAVGAIDIVPGDEVIVSPFTMSATASSVLIYGGTPVFADIDPNTFCITHETIESKLSEKTKAIIVVNLFGQCAELSKIMNLAKKYNLKVIEDCAQSPGAQHDHKYAGTYADIGVFSLNCFKTIQSGEGGIAVTNDRDLAYRLQLIRNHGEVVIHDKEWAVSNMRNLLGFNYRLTEIQAAIANEQLKKLDALNQERIHRVQYLNQLMQSFSFLQMPEVKKKNNHVYYLQAIKFNEKELSCSRDKFLDALAAEGVSMTKGYVEPLYLLPIYHEGKDSQSVFTRHINADVSYERGLCPIAEELHFRSLITNTLIYPPLTNGDLNDIVDAIEKIYKHIDDLR